MNSIKSFLRSIQFLVMGTLSFMHFAVAQDTEKKNTAKDLVESGSYVFEAQTALPLKGSVRQLTAGYDLRVSKDTINSYLPYFGRAYSAPIGTSEGGLDFTSTSFDYGIKPRKKGGWNVSIETKDQRDNKRMTLTIQESGYASLQVTSTDRQPITFNGIVTQTKKK